MTHGVRVSGGLLSPWKHDVPGEPAWEEALLRARGRPWGAVSINKTSHKGDKA